MFSFFRAKPKTPDENNSATVATSTTQAMPEKSAVRGFFSRLTAGLHKTRNQLTRGLANLILGRKVIDQQLLEDIETQLLSADVGIEATTRVINDLTDKLNRKQLNDSQALFDALKAILVEILKPCQVAFSLPEATQPAMVLMIGVNGAGKTTTIGKLAKHLQQQDKQIMLAAGDTFRAAAIEQLQVWGDRNDVAVVAQQQGNDSASVIFDAFQAAKARHIDVLIADTAGRLHTQQHLMEELKKIKRVIQKVDASAPHQVLLVLDASIGQNALNQAKQFHEAIGVSGLVITKLDGTAKGGIIFALAHNLRLPIFYIGVGEGIEDLRPFSADDFVDALLTQPTAEEQADAHSI